MRLGWGIVVLFCVAVSSSSAQDTVSVTTSIGVLNGKVETVNSFVKTGKLHTFLGVPYAEPPTGDMRFKKSVPKTPLNAPLDAFAHSNACMQSERRPNVSYSEDCLYLNIYAPERENENVKLPVMIWIYGGGFHFGDSNMYIGDYLAVHGHVIVVTLNYRLNVFGFLSTGDEASPGNYGLWDQHLAIKWVHENIAAFGGDTEKVAIFGESAGSSSVIYQGLYTGNRGLFQRIIAESGSIGGWFGSTDKGRQYAEKVGSISGCERETTHELVTCLRSLAADELSDKTVNAQNGVDLAFYPFLPTFDNDFIAFNPKDVFESSYSRSRDAVQFFSSLDLLTGVNIIEGVTGLSPMFGVTDIMNFETNRSDFENRLVPIFIKERFGEDTVSVLPKIISAEYTNWTDPNNPENVRNEFLRMHSDATFNSDMYKTLDAHTQQSFSQRTYMYMLDIEPETRSGYSIPYVKKAMHADELALVFGYRVVSYGGPFPTPTEWEIQLSTQIMTFWANFANTGNPNTPVDNGINWSPYTQDEQHYLHMTSNVTSENVRQRWNLRAASFWSDILPPLVERESCDGGYHGDTNSAISPSSGTMFSLLAMIFTNVLIKAAV